MPVKETQHEVVPRAVGVPLSGLAAQSSYPEAEEIDLQRFGGSAGVLHHEGGHALGTIAAGDADGCFGIVVDGYAEAAGRQAPDAKLDPRAGSYSGERRALERSAAQCRKMPACIGGLLLDKHLHTCAPRCAKSSHEAASVDCFPVGIHTAYDKRHVKHIGRMHKRA